MAEKQLLHSAVPLCEEFNIKWSSFESARPSSKGHEVILQTTESQTFWIPSPPSRDPHPCLEVEFKNNHVITAIELKGKARAWGGGDKKMPISFVMTLCQLSSVNAL